MQTIQDKTKEIEFFNNWSKSTEYKEAGHFTLKGYQRFKEEIIKYIGPKLSNPDCKAIDLGCGLGIFTNLVFNNVKASCFAMDISTNSIIRAQNMSQKIRYFVNDLEHLSIKDESIDVIIFSAVLHHFPDMMGALKESYRILKKKGCVVSYDPNINNPFMWLYRHPSSIISSRVGVTENERLLSSEDIESNLKRCGFGNIQSHCISSVPFRFVESKMGRMILPIYNFFDDILGKSPFALKHGAFLIGYAEKI